MGMMKKPGCHLLWILPAIAVGTVSACGDYRFGLLESDYPEYSGPASGGMNRVLKLNEEYSWHTELPIGPERITVEHGVLASQADVKRVGLPSGDYLFFGIEVEVSQVRSIQVSQTYKGEALEVGGTYIFRGRKLVEGDCVRAGPKWEVISYDGGELEEDCDFGYVRLYKMPEAFNYPVSEHNPFLFTAELHGHISLSTVGEGIPETYRFDLVARWHKASSLGWRLVTIT